MTDKLQKRPQPARTCKGDDQTDPKPGQWYWVQDVGHGDMEPGDYRYEQRHKQDRLMCVMRVGSNYVKLEDPHYSLRVHAEDFDERCTLEANPKPYLESKTQVHQDKAHALLAQIQQVTAQLGLVPRGQLGTGEPGEATMALVASDGVGDPKAHKKALIKAKEKTLPDLFEKLRGEHEAMAEWMKADLLPLEAQTDQLKKMTEGISDHIFAVELYAGLVEEVEQIQGGDAAPNDTKIVLHQRMCFMDEECLVNYQAGGMEFDDIGAFDSWLLEPANLERLLPHPRCMVAFRVRRQYKERSMDLSPWIKMELEQGDKTTFLYIRNGEQVYRLGTELDFGKRLFPDQKRSSLLGAGETLYGKRFCSRVDEIITEAQYERKVQKYDRQEAEYEAEQAAWEKRSKKYRKDNPHKRPHWWHWEDPRERFEKCTPDNVYYDDIMAEIGKQIQHHNRTVVILQGLLDRSPVLQPHPPWRLYTAEGFNQAVTLLYDDSRALPENIEPPDFEAFRRECNKHLKKGALTVGQQEGWERQEAHKENERQANDWRVRNSSDYTRFKPYGNPGPGEVARVVRYSKKHKQCTYAWERWSANYYWVDCKNKPGYQERARKRIGARCTVENGHLLCVDGYTPGDYKQFYEDPRTRAQYLRWAPLLLPAEDYHAGKLKVGSDESEDIY